MEHFDVELVKCGSLATSIYYGWRDSQQNDLQIA